MADQVRAFSFGGGVQSTACLVLAAQREIEFKTFLFANVGEDSENPATLRYVEEVARPYAEKHQLELVELRRRNRDGTPTETLRQKVSADNRSMLIPVRLPGGGPLPRKCTGDYKIRPITLWLRDHGATKKNPGISGLGISLDELHRARTDSGIAWQTLEYPLLDRRLSRQDCHNIISRAGLPTPPKSSCYFCPFHRLPDWRRMRRDQPEVFAQAVEFEKIVDEKGRRLLHRQTTLHEAGPLEEVVADDSNQLDIFGELDACESGYCWT